MTHIAIGALGTAGYSIFAIIAGLAALLPFTDLGVGAAITDVAARRRELGDERLLAVCVTSARILLISSAFVIGFGIAIALTIGWPSVLGASRASDANLATVLALSVFGLSIPLSWTSRVLIGAGRTSIAVVAQAAGSPVGLAIVGAASYLELPFWAYVVGPSFGTMVGSITAATLARRTVSVGRVMLGAVTPGLSGASVRQYAGPMLIISLMLPVAYQTDRIVLSHVSTLSAVATYSVAYQMFSPLSTVAGTAALSMWPIFARMRQQGVVRERIAPVTYRAAGLFAILAIAAAIGLLLLGGALSRVIAGDNLPDMHHTLAAFGLLLVVQAVGYPIVMTMTDPHGLRVQAWAHVALVLLNLPLSVLLGDRMGAPGPVLGSAISLVALIIPGARYLRSTGRVAWTGE